MFIDVTHPGAHVIPSTTWNAVWLEAPSGDETVYCSATGVLHLIPPAGASGVKLKVNVFEPDGFSLHVGDSPTNDGSGSYM